MQHHPFLIQKISTFIAQRYAFAVAIIGSTWEKSFASLVFKIKATCCLPEKYLFAIKKN
jgi:hypothetical protein